MQKALQPSSVIPPGFAIVSSSSRELDAVSPPAAPPPAAAPANVPLGSPLDPGLANLTQPQREIQP